MGFAIVLRNGLKEVFMIACVVLAGLFGVLGLMGVLMVVSEAKRG